MTGNEPALTTAKWISRQCVEHRNYRHVMERTFNALSVAQPGEVVVIVGPSRVGKSRAVGQALSQLARPREGLRDMPAVFVQAENASTLGAFSTKAFMQALCRSIKHPIYGMAEPGDPWGVRLSARVNRTPEGVLRDAVEHGLRLLSTRYLIIDEAHHVGYAGKQGTNALAVLDSWKCLAYKTSTVLCLVGSYQLLDILAHAPHLLGRQRIIEFPRYRATIEADVIAFSEVLSMWSLSRLFENPRENLLTSSRLLFTHSFGCIGHLARWLISALGEAAAAGSPYLSSPLLRATRHPAEQERAILAEIEAGERSISQIEPPERSPTSLRKSSTSPKPFRRKARRFIVNGERE